MLRTTALIIGAMTTDVFGTALLKTAPKKQDPAQKKKEDPCAKAMLTAANSVDEDIDLPIGQKVFVPSKISSTPSCPFQCLLNIDDKSVLEHFDSATGDIVFFTNNDKLAGKTIAWDISCESILSKSEVAYHSWLSVIKYSPQSSGSDSEDYESDSESSYGNGK